MYSEFVTIYVGLGIVIVLLAVLIVLAVLILKKIGSRPVAAPVSRGARTAVGATPAGVQNAGTGTVFCRSCSKQFDGAMRFCPHCGSAR